MGMLPRDTFHRCLAASAVIHALALIAIPVRGRMQPPPPQEIFVMAEAPEEMPEPELEQPEPEPPQERQLVKIAKFRARPQRIPRREPTRAVEPEPLEEPEVKAVEVALLPPPTAQDLAAPPEPTLEREQPLPEIEAAELPEARPEQMAALPEKLTPDIAEAPEEEAGTLPEAETIARAPQPEPLETPEPPDMEVPGPELEGPAKMPTEVAALPSPPAPSPKKEELGSGSIEKAKPELGFAMGEEEAAGPEGEAITAGVPREEAAAGPQDIGSAPPASVAAGPVPDFPDQPAGPVPRLGVELATLDAPGAAKGDGIPAGGFAKATPTLAAGLPEAEPGALGLGSELAWGAGLEPEAGGEPINVAPGSMGDEPIVMGPGIGGGAGRPMGGGGGVAVVLAGGLAGPGGGYGGSGLALGSGAGKGAPRLGVAFGQGEGDAYARRPGLGGAGGGGMGGGVGGGPGGVGEGGRGTGGPRGVAVGRAGGGIGTGPEPFGIPGAMRYAQGRPGARGLVPGIGPGGGFGGPGVGGPNVAGTGGGRGALVAKAVPGGIGEAVGADRGPAVRLGGGGGTGGTGRQPGGPGRRGPLQVGRGAGGVGVAADGPSFGLPPLPPVRAGGGVGLAGAGHRGGPGPSRGTKRTIASAKARPGGLYVNVSGIFDMPLGITTSDYNADASGMPNLLAEVRKRTDVDVTIRERFVPLQLDKIEDSPVIHLRGHKAFRLTPAEREVLRKYVQQGGTIFGEDSHGPFGECFRREMRKVFGVEPRDLPKGHELYQAFYVLDGVPRGDMGEQHPLQGISVGSRLGVIFSRNDYGDLWEGTGWWVRQEDREAAYKMGVNIYAYITAHWSK